MRLFACAVAFLSILLVGIPDMVRAEPKQVVIPYNDFLQILASKEHSDKLKSKLAAENAVLIKLKDEHGTIIKLQKEQLQACDGILKTQEQLGATQEEINKAVEAELLKVKVELEGEKSRHKWYAIGGVGIGVVIGMVIMVVVN